MEKVTYILGAGFSAPLGLPVMGNFLFKSRDMYFADKRKYDYFSNVFESINNLSIIKNYYQSDLFNIEEILSIIEMMSFLEGKKLGDDFKKYIIEVINYYTPEVLSRSAGIPGNWQDFVFGNQGAHSDLYYLIAHFLRAHFTLNSQNGRELHVSANSSIDARYSILSLNYDSALENASEFMQNHYTSSSELVFNKTDYDPEWEINHLIKLHGCVKSRVIVPPTWAKGTHPNIIPIWENAYHVLKDTNHIRFLGYSLPSSDLYIKYLLKSAITKSTHLKTIDVICLDADGSVKERYDEFLEFNYYRFAKKNIIDYASGLKNEVKSSTSRLSGVVKNINMNKLENWHSSFMVS